MSEPAATLPYRITVEVHISPGVARTISVTGDLSPVADPFTDNGLTANAAAAMLLQSHQMATHVLWFHEWDRVRKALSTPTNRLLF